MIGYRARQLAPMVSVVSILPRPWAAPTLYGNRLSLVFGGPPSFRMSESARRQVSSVHPFAEDRETYYRFSGGDTAATIRTATGVIPLVRIHVEPQVVRAHVMAFAGDVFVDGITGQIAQLRGRIRIGVPANASSISRLARALGQVREVAFVDFTNSLYEGKFWLPHRQRLEYQVTTGLTEARATIRVQSVWRDVQLQLVSADSTSTLDTLGSPRYSLNMLSDTARSDKWRYDLGAMTADASARDFDDVAPPELRADGSPQWRWQARGFSDMIRFNRVEGLFLGTAGVLDMRRALPGVSVRAFGGWAWSGQSLKGGIEAVRVREQWVASLRAERQLASTNDFSQILGGGNGNAIASLFGREDFDWVDRRVLAAGVTREFGARHSSAIRLELAHGNDRGFAHELTAGPISGVFRPNRPVDPGSYVRSRVQVELGRNIVSSPLASGIGVNLIYERGDGTLDWQRTQLQGLVQHTVGRFVFALKSDGALARSAHLPAQQFLEIGGAEGLPGYDYKAFAGDGALIARTTAAYLLPIWESPTRLHKLVLPAIAPQLQIGLFSGNTTASKQSQAILDSLGWSKTNGWKGSLDVRLRFFAGALSIGVSRAIDRNERWRAAFGLGGTL